MGRGRKRGERREGRGDKGILGRVVNGRECRKVGKEEEGRERRD